MKRLLLAAAVLPLPYTLNLTGEAPFYAKQGLPDCLGVAREDLIRQRNIVAATCARDGGRLRDGQVTETLVEGVHCTAVLPLTCESPDASSSESQAPRSFTPEAPKA